MATKSATCLTAGVSPKSVPSLYHAQLSTILQMSSCEFLSYLDRISQRNLCLEIQTDRRHYSLNDGELIVETGGPDSWTRSEGYVRFQPDRGPNEPRHDYDFTESLTLFLAAQRFPAGTSPRKGTFEIIVEYIDSRGFLVEDADAIAACHKIGTEEMRKALDTIARVPPGGIGSRDLAQFLWFQCSENGWDDRDMHRLLFELLEDVARGDIRRICRRLGVGEGHARRMIKRLKSLRPYPAWGMDFQTVDGNGPVGSPAPDFRFYERGDGTCVLEMREPAVEVHRLSISMDSREAAGPETQDPESEWALRARLLEQEAEWLKAAVRRRGRALLMVLVFLLDLQKDWLLARKDYLEPIAECQLAEALGIPGSTVSRALKDRYIACPRGTFPLKRLLSRRFSTPGSDGVSKDFVCRLIVKLERETAGAAATDMEIARALESNGIRIARRTVNKYRNELRGG